MLFFDFAVALAIVGGAAAIFYFFFFNTTSATPQKKATLQKKAVEAPAPAQQKPASTPASAPAKKEKKVQQPASPASPASSAESASPTSPSKPKKTKEEKKAQKARVAKARAEKDAELDALVAADLKAAKQGIRNDAPRGTHISLEEATKEREIKAAKKAEAKAATQPVVQNEEVLEEGFVAVKSENKKPAYKKISQKAEVDREVLTAAEEMDRRLRMFFSQSSGKKYSSPTYGNDDRKADGPIRIKALSANKGWGGEDN